MTDKTEEKAAVKTEAEGKAAAPAAQEPQVYVHALRLYLVGGQVYLIRELTNSPTMSQNIVAFINAWRQHRDVWHSPNNDPKFGVRVRDVSLYEYSVARVTAKEKEEGEAEPKKEEKKAAKAK